MLSHISIPSSSSTSTINSWQTAMKGISGCGPKLPSLARPSETPVFFIPSRAFLMAVSNGVPLRSISPVKVPSLSVSISSCRNSAKEQIYKGLREREDLAAAISCCRELSGDGLARIETDMRAHMNPTRMRVLRRLGIKLSKRLQRKCASCGCPGFGLTGGEGSLLCEECNYPSETPAMEVYSCLKCNHRMLVPRRDGITHIEAMYCQRCNP